MALVGWEIFTLSKLREEQIIAIHGSFMKSSNKVLGGREEEIFSVVYRLSSTIEDPKSILVFFIL